MATEPTEHTTEAGKNSPSPDAAEETTALDPVEAAEVLTPEEVEQRNADDERKLSQAMLTLRKQTPFFYMIAFFARNFVREDAPDHPFAIRTAATDGRDIFWDRSFLHNLSPAETVGVLLHEVLHAALLHVPRRGKRDPVIWNLAADIVVNGMIDDADQKARQGSGGVGRAIFSLPEGAVRDKEHCHLSVEEVYELIEAKVIKIKAELSWQDLLENGPNGKDTLDSAARHAALEAYWRAARSQAEALHRTVSQGNLPVGLEREWSSLNPAQLDWRARLWRYLVRTPTDFTGFDRRFIGRGLYLEALEGESLKVCVGIDTSGSISDRDLGAFLSEVQGILRSYPHLSCFLYYVDAAAYGPYLLTADTDVKTIPKPIGGGGTDFRPFFEAVDRDTDNDYETANAKAQGGVGVISVYLTDGMGSFPTDAPSYPVLWVCLPGGIPLENFPFGEAVRLIVSE
jgi:predicted metal-dependent peptidase